MPVLTEAEIAVIRQETARVMWPSQGWLWQATKNLLDTLDVKDERIKELEEGLKEIMAGKWTESGDKLGAAFSEIRAMQRARKALGEKGDGR